MNLNKTWKLCLSMWRWIAEERRKGNTLNVEMLKAKWLRKHGFAKDSIFNDCFFCQYSETHDARVEGDCAGCTTCPGTRVDRTFDCQDQDNGYHFYREPIAFYNKLRALNRKRTAKK